MARRRLCPIAGKLLGLAGIYGILMAQNRCYVSGFWRKRKGLGGHALDFEMRILGLLFVVGVLSQASFSEASELECGDPFVNGVGPYDYNDPEARSHPSKIPIVERAHFTAKVESLKEGQSLIDPAGDIDYTLRAVPNHHRALLAISKYELQRGKIDSRYRTAECYFDRAKRFRPQDALVRMLYGMHYSMRNRYEEALNAYRSAEELLPDAAELQYHIGLTLIELGRYEEAQVAARKAYDGGYPLPGLRNKLDRLGYGIQFSADQ